MKAKKNTKSTKPFPRFIHFDEDKYNIVQWAESVSVFLHTFVAGYVPGHVRFKIRHDHGAETIEFVPNRTRDMQYFLQRTTPDCDDIFFCPQPVPEPGCHYLSRFAWCDTGGVYPGIFDPQPEAFWETSRGNYQAIWWWDRGLPPKASETRVEAMIYEFGGKLGSHRLDSFLRVPGSVNNSKTRFPGPSVRLLYSRVDGIKAPNQIFGATAST